MLVTILLALAAIAESQNPPQVNFMLGCGFYPQVCNNKCYAIYRGGAPQTVTYSAAARGVTDQRRNQAGTANPNPCCNRITRPTTCYSLDGLTTVPCSSPDEYPYASTDEWGNGPSGYPTYIRCTGIDENLYEGVQDYNNIVLAGPIDQGGCGRRRGCRITIGFAFIDARAFACQARQAAVSDGNFWQYNGAYSPYRRDLDGGDHPIYERADPPEHLFIPPEDRRELLLDSGDRVIVAPEQPGDPERPWIGEVWTIGLNNTAKVVRELFGEEKSEPFRPANMTSTMI